MKCKSLSMNGYIIISENAEAIYILDADNPDDATNVWRFNASGWALSTTGYNGTYRPIITMPATLNISNLAIANSLTANLQVVTGINQSSDKTVSPITTTLKIVNGIITQ